MNTYGRFETPTSYFRQVEFYDFRTDNFLRVEQAFGKVVVRTLREVTSTAERKCFIRKLALEGFIADRHRWACDESDVARAEIAWIVDSSWLHFKHKMGRLVSRFWRPVLATTVLFLVLGGVPLAGLRLIEQERAAVIPHGTAR